ncbi:coiled-coil domain-containing protein 127-like [Paramisgurnus dabryanus]|uniref:coiled-coil domain-containing protein 127-like n=1 Tax=Paramisgurnus dabryanus TaxID=90735 RepID=UPI0031F373CC
MNNPEDWNNGPEQPGKDNSEIISRMLTLLGLAAYRCIWDRNSQKKINQIQVKHEMDMKIKNIQIAQLKRDLERKDKAVKKNEEMKTSVALKEVEDKLKERQKVFCSYTTPRNRRFEIEKDLMNLAKQPCFAHLNMEDGLRNIFKHDRSCDGIFDKDDSRNGTLMGKFLSEWKLNKIK